MANSRNLPLSYRPIRRFAALLVGLVLYGTGMSLMIAASLGLDPWDVFHQGMSKLVHVQFGWVVIATGILVLLLWIPLRQMPGIGTVSNAILIGVVVNIVSAVLPVPHILAVRWAYALGGILAIGIGTGLYIGARLGPGPRDGLMTGFVAKYAGRKFASIRIIRTAIEATVLVVGFILGGQVGWVTLIFAVSIGPLAHVSIPLFHMRDPEPPQQAAIDEPADAPAQASNPAPTAEPALATTTSPR